MYAGFFFELRRAEVPVTLREYLTLLEALQSGAAGYRIESFYHLARAALVKDERYFDRFDRVFASWFEGLERIEDPFQAIPEEWLRRMGERYLSEEERRRIQSLGGWRALMETLRQRLAEQQKRHQGGSKWIGTGGTSPFGAHGYHPEGVRIGQQASHHRSAVKVWDRREFRDLDGGVELGTRGVKLALRKLRRLARTGAEDELDLSGTIEATAKNAGFLDVRMQPERENRANLLMLFDVGGSMDDHVEATERLFSAARSEFKHLEFFYFHNFLYERVWKNNALRDRESLPTRELLRTYGRNYRVVFVGDASMSPYEITEPGGSVEHWNDEPGYVWMQRVLAQWDRVLWINPLPMEHWRWTRSVAMIRELTGGRMVPLSLEGIERGVRLLR